MPGGKEQKPVEALSNIFKGELKLNQKNIDSIVGGLTTAHLSEIERVSNSLGVLGYGFLKLIDGANVLANTQMKSLDEINQQVVEQMKQLLLSNHQLMGQHFTLSEKQATAIERMQQSSQAYRERMGRLLKEMRSEGTLSEENFTRLVEFITQEENKFFENVTKFFDKQSARQAKVLQKYQDMNEAVIKAQIELAKFVVEQQTETVKGVYNIVEKMATKPLDAQGKAVGAVAGAISSKAEEENNGPAKVTVEDVTEEENAREAQQNAEGTKPEAAPAPAKPEAAAPEAKPEPAKPAPAEPQAAPAAGLSPQERYEKGNTFFEDGKTFFQLGAMAAEEGKTEEAKGQYRSAKTSFGKAKTTFKFFTPEKAQLLDETDRGVLQRRQLKLTGEGKYAEKQLLARMK